jgi:hypothetical protein
MIIDTSTYVLSEKNYIKDLDNKSFIIFGHTSTTNMNHFVGWVNRYNGKYRKTAAYTIGFDGTIYRHFNPEYRSNYFNNIEMDSKSIVILLENEGYLTANEEKTEFIGWLGNIYNRSDIVVRRKWRGYEYWAPYTQEQMDSAIQLTKTLCDDFSIPRVAMEHNTKVDDFGDYAGVLYKSNLNKLATDLSAAWDYTEFKERLETKENE